jgi:hypothetical protein
VSLFSKRSEPEGAQVSVDGESQGLRGVTPIGVGRSYTQLQTALGEAIQREFSVILMAARVTKIMWGVSGRSYSSKFGAIQDIAQRPKR